MAKNSDKLGISTQYEDPVVLLKKWVDFHYQDYVYSINGGDSIILSQLLEQLEMPISLEQVANVTFSDPTLVEVTYKEPVFGVTGDWKLTSLVPFLTEETLHIELKDGTSLDIVVTDAQLTREVITAAGETYEITVTYGEDAQIPDGATLEITEFAENSEEYQAARKAVVDNKQSEYPEFDENEMGFAAFDLSIVDKDGEQIEPEAAVSVSMKLKSLPEEAVEETVQNSIEIQHLDESSGDIKVETVASTASGSIQIDKETAQAEFQIESFSTFTISWSANANNSSTTVRWQYTYGNWGQQQTGSRAYVNVYYVDESGNAINRPASVGSTIDYNLGDDGEIPVDIGNVLAKEISGYTFERAYINHNGNQVDVATVVGGRDNPWNYNYVVYYDQNNDEVHRGGDWVERRYQGESIYLVYSGGPHTTIHYGYMDGDTFVEFDEQPSPTDTDANYGWAYLIYDFHGTDENGLPFEYNYSTTYYQTSETTDPTTGGTSVAPLLRYYNSDWRYYAVSHGYDQNSVKTNGNWDAAANNSHLYVVYEKPTIQNGGTPKLSQNSPTPDTPDILKQSVENGDGTNTLSLSITGSTSDMEVEKLADVIVVLDLSSSMQNNIHNTSSTGSGYATNENSRYYQAKQAVLTLANNLYNKNEEDKTLFRMGLVTFAGSAQVRQQLTDDKDTFLNTVNAISRYEGKGTNWEHAIKLANEMAVDPNRATFVIFITDGEPTASQTRWGLSNSQLEDSIFISGSSGGKINNGYSHPVHNDSYGPFHFYLRNGTFGTTSAGQPGTVTVNDTDLTGDIMNNRAAYDDAKSIVDHNKNFYVIAISSDVGTDALNGILDAAEVPRSHGIPATNQNELTDAFNQIESQITGFLGWGEVNMFDGITDLTQTISKVNQEENRLIGADGNFTYWKSTAPTGWSNWTSAEKEAYNAGMQYAGSEDKPEGYDTWTDAQKAAFTAGQSVTFTEWTTREADGCAAAIYNTDTDAVEWNMGKTFMLEDGVTYKVSFICWPSQEAYDIIAKLNNGTLTYGDTSVYSQDVWNQFEGNATDGYTLKTNADGAKTTYKSATNMNGIVTVGEQQAPLFFQHVPPMPLEKDKLNVAKTWEASKIDSQTPEPVVLQVVGDDSLYKQFEIEPTEKRDGSEANNYGRSENIYISCGHIKVNKATGSVVVYESGHDFTLREVEENSRHWDLSASTCHPMVIGDGSGTLRTMLVLVEGNDIPGAMQSNTSLGYLSYNGDDYYRIGGKVYKDTKEWADITGYNTRRSFLDLAKEVVVDGAVWQEPVDTKFTYKIKITVDPETLSWDPNLEKYVIISIRGEGYTPSAAINDETYSTTAKLPSQSGMDSSLVHEGDDDRYLVAESGVEFYLSIRNGWSVRFLNLPAGTTYSIEEVIGEDGDYSFNNVRLETRKDRTSTNPDSTETHTQKKLEGSIPETSTLYKVVYQNKAKEQTVMILKTAQDASTLLGGAKFDLYTESAYTSDPKGAPLKEDLISSDQSATKGQIDLGSLPVGTYYLVETKAPDGYILREDPVIITVTGNRVTYNEGTTLSNSGNGVSQIEDVWQLKVTNNAGAALPYTGGPGTSLIYLLGIMFTGVAGTGLVMWKRQKGSA